MLVFAGLLLQNTYGGCFWIFAAADTFSELNLVFITNSHIGFCSKLLYWNSSVKKGVLRNFANFNTDVFLWNLQNF